MADLRHGQKLLGLYTGVVVDNVDPLGKHRVRVRIPGLLEPASAWAWPLGVGGGSAQRGFFQAPARFSEVGVLFNHGEPDSPHYLGGHWGQPRAGSEMPTPARDADPSEAHLLAGLETDDWLIVADDRTTSKRLAISHKPSGMQVELDGLRQIVTVSSAVGIRLKTTGFLDLQGTVVTINGRPVLPSGGSI